jgi:hypothetical protein
MRQLSLGALTQRQLASLLVCLSVLSCSSEA